MPKITISVECSNEDEALDVVSRIAGVDGADVETNDTPAKPKKKATPKQKAAEETKKASKAPKKPAKPKAKKSEAPTVEELKDQILEAAGGDMTDPDVAASVKEYIGSFGVAKISDLSDEQRQEAFDGAEDYFAGGEEEGEEEDDPMA